MEKGLALRELYIRSTQDARHSGAGNGFDQ
jgi:hypothetical protein